MDGYTGLDIRPDLDVAPWVHADAKIVGELQIESIGLLRHGTSEGRVSVGVLLRASDGTYLVAQTTWRLFNAAARALAASPAVAEEVND